MPWQVWSHSCGQVQRRRRWWRAGDAAEGVVSGCGEEGGVDGRAHELGCGVLRRGRSFHARRPDQEKDTVSIRAQERAKCITYLYAFPELRETVANGGMGGAGE